MEARKLSLSSSLDFSRFLTATSLMMNCENHEILQEYEVWALDQNSPWNAWNFRCLEIHFYSYSRVQKVKTDILYAHMFEFRSLWCFWTEFHVMGLVWRLAFSFWITDI